MTPKEKAESLVGKFKIHCYCYLGSGMLSNTHDESVQLSNAKQCALICVEEMIQENKSIHAMLKTFGDARNRLPVVERISYLEDVKTEIEKL